MTRQNPSKYLARLQRSLIAFIVIAATAVSAETPTVADLHWMTGSWRGSFGENMTLEETWSAPRSGTIAALVRNSDATTTHFVELINIVEEDGTLMLRLQQFNETLEPLFSPAQALRLDELTPNSATFVTHTNGGLKKLIYTREAQDKFSVDVTLTEGPNFKVNLDVN